MLAGPDPDSIPQDLSLSVCAVLEEQKHKKSTQPAPISGPELGSMMKVGTRVVRGVDWKWGDQVGVYSSPLCVKAFCVKNPVYGSSMYINKGEVFLV